MENNGSIHSFNNHITPLPSGGGVGGEAVACFDFDGTLTTRDTLLEFIRYARGTWSLFWGFLLYSPLLVLMKLRLYPNYRAKQRIFSYYFRGMTIEAFDSLCQRFARDNRERLLRPEGIATLRQALADGAQVLIVSASIDNWVRPFFAGTVLPLSSGSITVLGTQVEVRDRLLTGRFLTKNCYGAEKVHRIEAVLTEPRENYHIVAYGDSRGDKEMLEYADEKHYKPFR